MVVEGIIKSNKGFYVGDPCYVLSDEIYHHFWGEVCHWEDGIHSVPVTGEQFAVNGTAYGDGEYFDEHGRAYGVDSGTLSVIPLELVEDIGCAKDCGYVTEKRKVLYHWLGMLNSLKRLHDAGEIDIDLTVAHLTDPMMLERVNGFLSENPNLLETDKYILLHSLLGRDLYKEKQLIPIKEAEITSIAKTYGYELKTVRPEEN